MAKKGKRRAHYWAVHRNKRPYIRLKKRGDGLTLPEFLEQFTGRLEWYQKEALKFHIDVVKKIQKNIN